MKSDESVCGRLRTRLSRLKEKMVRELSQHLSRRRGWWRHQPCQNLSLTAMYCTSSVVCTTDSCNMHPLKCTKICAIWCWPQIVVANKSFLSGKRGATLVRS